jgi:hypothetical protein
MVTSRRSAVSCFGLARVGDSKPLRPAEDAHATASTPAPNHARSLRRRNTGPYNTPSTNSADECRLAFANLAKKRLKRGVFRSLQKTPSIASSTKRTQTWTKDPNKIIAAVKRGHQALDSLH